MKCPVTLVRGVRTMGQTHDGYVRFCQVQYRNHLSWHGIIKDMIRFIHYVKRGKGYQSVHIAPSRMSSVKREKGEKRGWMGFVALWTGTMFVLDVEYGCGENEASYCRSLGFICGRKGRGTE